MNELIYNQWHFPRTQLAKSYLEILTKGPGDPIALQCPRRWGKTTFLLTEMSQVAVDAGFLCVYIDVWQNRSDVLGAINYGLQEAIDELEVPKTVIGKTLKTPVKKVAAGPIALDFGEEPTRRRPESQYLLVDWLVKSLARLAGRPVLLLFDEIQEVAVSSDGENIVSALRAAVTKSKRSIRVVFTGSNQERLRGLFSKSRAALYEGASIIAFPRLGDDFLSFVSQQAVRIFRRRIPENELRNAFERFQYQPRALVDLVFLFASGPHQSFSDLLNERLEETLAADIVIPQFDALTPLQRQIAARLAAGGDVSSIEARFSYAKGLRRKTISPGSINNALKALVQKHIISKPVGSRGGYTFDDPAFREWLRLSARSSAARVPLPGPAIRLEDLLETTGRDVLTGVYNRRYFERALRTTLTQATASNLPTTLILLDVDKLKPLNDAHGHVVGDSVLKAIAGRILQVLRSTDVVGRYGGDEFAIVLQDTPAQQGVDVASEICAVAARTPIQMKEGELFVSVSCGVASAPRASASSAEAILADADAALFVAKKEGGNRAVFHLVKRH
jgi:uncharacterized protein